MAIPTHDVSLDGGDHVVHLYEHDSELVELSRTMSPQALQPTGWRS